VVSLDIDDLNDQNLTVRLYSPNFTIIELFSHVGGNGHNFRNTVLADDAATSIADGEAPFTGRFRPLTPLGTFVGELANGTWLLEIDDAITEVVEAYVRHKLMPQNPLGDALHLALASYYKCDFLLTWNCKHLANANKFDHIGRVNTLLGLYVPKLVTPLELLGG
jgi:hypothetical protein